MLQLTESQAKNRAAQVTLSLQHTFGERQELQQVQRNDTVGGITRSKDSRCSFDDELRLTQAQSDIGGTGGTDTETFTLDALANRTAHNKYPGACQFDANNRLTQRLWKEQYLNQDGNPLAAPIRTTYLYADEGLIAEASQVITLSADGSVTASAASVVTTQYGPRPDTPFTTGMLFIKTQNSKGQDTLAYYHHDHLGTPIQATDKTGRVVWAADYNAFGLASIITPAATEEAPTIGSNLRLPGQYWDEESGLHYNWHRYYDAATGRYVQSDPIGLAGGTNRFAYAYGNPLRWPDPAGLDVYLCKQPAFGIPNGPVDHHWVKTDTMEAGMGGTRGNVPGNESGDRPGYPMQVVSHPNRSKEPVASCQKVDGVDEKKVNDALKIGRPLGRWGPTNQCQSFARQTLLDAGWKDPRPPYISNPLPPFGF